MPTGIHKWTFKSAISKQSLNNIISKYVVTFVNVFPLFANIHTESKCVLISLKSCKPVHLSTHVEKCVYWGKALHCFTWFEKSRICICLCYPLANLMTHSQIVSYESWRKNITTTDNRNLCFRLACFKYWLVHYNYSVGTWVLEYDADYYNYIFIYLK